MPSRNSAAVDELILDYLLHSCISALLLEWSVGHSLREGGYSHALVEAANNADRSLLLVNCMSHWIHFLSLLPSLLPPSFFIRLYTFPC